MSPTTFRIQACRYENVQRLLSYRYLMALLTTYSDMFIVVSQVSAAVSSFRGYVSVPLRITDTDVWYLTYVPVGKFMLRIRDAARATYPRRGIPSTPSRRRADHDDMMRLFWMVRLLRGFWMARMLCKYFFYAEDRTSPPSSFRRASAHFSLSCMYRVLYSVPVHILGHTCGHTLLAAFFTSTST